MEFSSNLTLGILNEPFLLEKRIRLLNAIEQYGSILKAAKNVPMSYKAAWDSIDAMNNLSPPTHCQSLHRRQKRRRHIAYGVWQKGG